MYNLNAPIKGWDYVELAKMLTIATHGDDEEDLADIRQGLGRLRGQFFPWGEKTPEDEEAVAWIRRWLKKLASEDNDYLAPLYLGIASIEDARMMIQVVEINLGLLWT